MRTSLDLSVLLPHILPPIQLTTQPATFGPKTLFLLLTTSLSTGPTMMFYNASAKRLQTMAIAGSGSWHWVGCMDALVYAILASINGRSSVMSGIGVGTYLPAEVMVYVDGDSRVSF